MGSQFFDRSKLINQKSLKQKEQKFGHVSGLKPFQRLKQDYMLQFFLEILQAVYLGFVHIPKLGSIPFQTIELKLVQRCGSHMEAQSCNASYCKTIIRHNLSFKKGLTKHSFIHGPQFVHLLLPGPVVF